MKGFSIDDFKKLDTGKHPRYQYEEENNILDLYEYANDDDKDPKTPEWGWTLSQNGKEVMFVGGFPTMRTAWNDIFYTFTKEQ